MTDKLAVPGHRANRIPVVLSTVSVWPEPVSTTFELAAELGYDGVEIMVLADPVSQRPAELERLMHRYRMPVTAFHAPCLLLTQRVWDSDPLVRLRKSAQAAMELGASTVVVHPPFRWQRRYAEGFGELVAELEDVTGVAIAVENMFPVRRGRMSVSGFTPSFDPTDAGYEHYTLDLSHTAAAQQDALELAKRMGRGLAHVHLADGSGAPRDEHLLPGTGSQPCAELCAQLRDEQFDGVVSVEVSTRRLRTRRERRDHLAEALRFARTHL